MGLASYGEPKYKDRIKKILKSKSKNFFDIDLKYFDHNESVIDYDFESGYPYFDDLYSKKFEKLFGKSRKPNEPIKEIHKDLAASLQKGFEEVILEKINNLKLEHNNIEKNLNLGGKNSGKKLKLLIYINYEKSHNVHWKSLLIL